MRYTIIIEQGEHNLSAYVSGLPGYATTGATREEVIARMREAIEPHWRGLQEDGDPIPQLPQPNSDPAFVEVSMLSSISESDCG